MATRWSSSYVAWAIRHRRSVALVCLLVTAAALGVISRGVFASSVVKLFFGGSDGYRQYRGFADQFGESDFLFVGFQDATLLEPAGMARLQRITERLGRVSPIVARVKSLATAQRLSAPDETLHIESYADAMERLARADPGQAAEQFRREVLADRRVAQLFVSGDGSAGAVLIELTNDDDRAIESLPAFLDAVVEVFRSEGFSREHLHLAGLVAESVEATTQARYNINALFPLTALMVVLVVFLLFHRLWPVVLTATIALVAIIWTFAFAILLDREVNLLLAAVPAVMMVVSLSDTIHLYSAFLAELRAGADKQHAIIRSGGEVGQACVLTSATTFVGFVAMAFVPTPVFRQLGVVMGMGVCLALLLAMTLVPIALSWLPAPPVDVRDRRANVAVDWVVRASQRLSERYPRQIVAASAVVMLIAAICAMQIHIETAMVDRLAPDNHIRRAHRFISQHFAGTNAIDVYLVAAEPEAMLDVERVRRIDAFATQLEQVAGVDRVDSFVDVMRVINEQLARREGLPTDREALAQYLLLFEMAGGDGLESLLDDARSVARVAVRLDRPGFVQSARIGHEAARMAAQALGPAVQAVPTGLTFLFGDWIDFVIAGQKRGLLFAFITTTLMMALMTRGLGSALVAMVPNVLPLLVLAGYLGWAWPSVDSDTLLIAMIAIGIAVDDTIHFLSRLRIELQRGSPSLTQALHRTFGFSGRAMVQTSVVLCLGFLPFATSDYFSTRIMGTLLPMTLAVALLADLLLVPALVQTRLLRLPHARAGEAVILKSDDHNRTAGAR